MIISCHKITDACHGRVYGKWHCRLSDSVIDQLCSIDIADMYCYFVDGTDKE